MLQKIEITVGINDFLRARQAKAVNQAGMVKSIGEDDIAGIEDRAQQPGVGRESRAEIECRFGACKIGKSGLKFVPGGMVSTEQPCAG